MKDRDVSIDVLRCIALIGIIVIHANPTNILIREIRSFDVPLMVFLSGVSYVLSQKESIRYGSYIRKRFIRIIIPTWIFLFLYHSTWILLLLLTHHTINFLSMLPTLISQFTLMTGWYVWIMRLFFVIAIFTPSVVKLTDRLNAKQYLTILACCFLLNEILTNTRVGGGGTSGK